MKISVKRNILLLVFLTTSYTIQPSDSVRIGNISNLYNFVYEKFIGKRNNQEAVDRGELQKAEPNPENIEDDENRKSQSQMTKRSSSMHEEKHEPIDATLNIGKNPSSQGLISIQPSVMEIKNLNKVQQQDESSSAAHNVVETPKTKPTSGAELKSILRTASLMGGRSGTKRVVIIAPEENHNTKKIRNRSTSVSSENNDRIKEPLKMVQFDSPIQISELFKKVFKVENISNDLLVLLFESFKKRPGSGKSINTNTLAVEFFKRCMPTSLSPDKINKIYKNVTTIFSTQTATPDQMAIMIINLLRLNDGQNEYSLKRFLELLEKTPLEELTVRGLILASIFPFLFDEKITDPIAAMNQIMLNSKDVVTVENFEQFIIQSIRTESPNSNKQQE